MTKHSSIKGKPFIYVPKDIASITENFKTLDVPEKDKKQILSNIQNNLGEEHPFEYEEIDGLVKKFGLVNAVLDKITDYIVGRGMYVQSQDEKVEDELSKWMERTWFRVHLRPWVKEALAKGPGYLEVAGLSDASKDNTIKIVGSNSIYAVKDEVGTIIGYNQYVGKGNMVTINSKDTIKLNAEEIIQFNVNKIGNSAYGQGIIYSALNSINNFLLAQKEIHRLIARKGGAPIHVKLGNVEKDDYPSQADIEAYGTQLQFMNNMTEWVTGPNVEMKVIDFGNLGANFATVLDNDYKLLSYSFQVPETLLGAGNVPEGLARVQNEAFERRISSLQDDLAYVLKYKIFDKVLENNGFKLEDVEYQIVWGQSTEEDINKRLDVFKNILSVGNLSPGMKKEIEKKIANELDIDYEDIEDTNIEDTKLQKATANDQFKRQVALQKMNKRESMQLLTENLKGKYKHQDVHEKLIENVAVSQWIHKDMSTYKSSIIESIEEDTFEDLRADNEDEKKIGYLDNEQIVKLKRVYKEAVERDLGVNDIKEKILNEVKLQDLNVTESIGIDKVDRADMIAKTELTRLLNKTLLKEYKKKQVVLLKWDAILDERVCPVCAGLNNQVFDGDTITQDMIPPIHPNCRCNLEELSHEQKMDISQILKNSAGKAPQEIEEQLIKDGKIEPTKAMKLVKNYFQIQDTIVEDKK